MSVAQKAVRTAETTAVQMDVQWAATTAENLVDDLAENLVVSLAG